MVELRVPSPFAPGPIGQGFIGRFAPGSEWAWERKGCESNSAHSH